MDIEDYKFGVARQARLDAKESIMEINYAKIIETADARRKALEDLTSSFQYAATYCKELEAAQSYVKDLRDIYRRLDDEGRQLLPQNVRTVMDWIEKTETSIGNALENSTGCIVYGMRRLVAVTSRV